MKYIKKIQHPISKSNPKDFLGYPRVYQEVWESWNDKSDITGFSLKLLQEDIEELKRQNIIFIFLIDNKYGPEPMFLEKDREKIEEFLEIRRNTKKYNL